MDISVIFIRPDLNSISAETRLWCRLDFAMHVEEIPSMEDKNGVTDLIYTLMPSNRYAHRMLSLE